MGFDDLEDAIEEQEQRQEQKKEQGQEQESVDMGTQDQDGISTSDSSSDRDTLDEAVDDAEDEATYEVSEGTSVGGSSSRSIGTEPGSESTSISSTEQQDTDPLSTPAFEFDATTQKGFYGRDEAWSEFEAALDFDIKRELHEQGVEDVSRSELTEAVLWLTIEEPEAVAEQVMAMRRNEKL